MEQYGTNKYNEVATEEVKNKRGQTYYSANRMVVTCTIRSIHDHLPQSYKLGHNFQLFSSVMQLPKMQENQCLEM